MDREHAQALLNFIAELYLICRQETDVQMQVQLGPETNGSAKPKAQSVAE
jgi:hypothetical protein